MAKAATDKMTADMAHELREHGVAVVSLYPGLVRTEKVLEAAAYLDLGNSESPQFIGRAIAALAADPNLMSESGTVVVAAACANEYGLPTSTVNILSRSRWKRRRDCAPGTGLDFFQFSASFTLVRIRRSEPAYRKHAKI